MLEGFEGSDDAVPAHAPADTRFAQLLLEESGLVPARPCLARKSSSATRRPIASCRPGSPYWQKTPGTPVPHRADLDKKGRALLDDTFFQQGRSARKTRSIASFRTLSRALSAEAWAARPTGARARKPKRSASSPSTDDRTRPIQAANSSASVRSASPPIPSRLSRCAKELVTGPSETVRSRRSTSARSSRVTSSRSRTGPTGRRPLSRASSARKRRRSWRHAGSPTCSATPRLCAKPRATCSTRSRGASAFRARRPTRTDASDGRAAGESQHRRRPEVLAQQGL